MAYGVLTSRGPYSHICLDGGRKARDSMSGTSSYTTRPSSRAIGFEVHEKPWLGPKSRGKAILEASPLYGREVTEEEFLEYINFTYPALSRYVQWVRFHKCTFFPKPNQKSSWHMRFAIVFTAPNTEVRQRLFEAAREVADNTGWYPLVMGQRVRKRRRKHDIKMASDALLRDVLGQQPLGRILGVSAVNRNSSGTAIACNLEAGTIMLDFGFNYEATAHKPIVGLLSHTHMDHSGGLKDALEAGLQVLTSEEVYYQLRAIGLDLNWSNIHTVRLPAEFPLPGGGSILLTPGAHTPGAMMVRIVDAFGNQLFYPGDFCLSNAYYSLQAEDFLSNVDWELPGEKTVLIDGTFLHHGPQNSTTNINSLESMLTRDASDGRSSIFVADSPDYLYPLYLWFFRAFYVGPKTSTVRPLVASRSVLRLLETLFDPFILRQHTRYDALMRQWAGVTQHNFLESVHLYPVSRRIGNHLTGPVAAFVTAKDLAEHPWLQGKDAALYSVGRRRQPDSLPHSRVTYLEGPDISFHSKEQDVAELVAACIERGAYPILFHNFKGRIRKGLSKHGILDGYAYL